MAKFRVTLTEEERSVLRKIVSSGKGAARKLLHGRILLQADASPEGMQYTDEAIAEALSVSLSTIHRVRQQFVEDSHSRQRRILLKINDLSHSAFVNIKPIESTTYAFYAIRNAASFELSC